MKINKFVCLLITILFIKIAVAERVEGKTIGYATVGGEAVIELEDSARVYPFEPSYGKWRLVMWAGYVDTADVVGDSIAKAQSIGLDNLDLKTHAKLLKEAPLFNIEHNTLYGKKMVVVYAYIPNNKIREDSRLEHRLEKVLKARKKKREEAFNKFKSDFGFVDAILIDGKYNMHFVYDERSPEGANDFRLLVFTNTNKEIIAVAHEGYRKLKLKYKSKDSLDRKLMIYFLIKIGEENQNQIKERFLEAYRFRDY